MSDTANGQPLNAQLAQIEQVCARRGLRLTALRRRIMELIVEQAKPVKAYDLLDLIRQERGGAAPPTVYRALDFLLEHGFIHKLESINAFISCEHLHDEPGSPLHQPPFLICDRCSRTVELNDTRAAEVLAREARRLGFTPQAQTLEIHGLCARCGEQ